MANLPSSSTGFGKANFHNVESGAAGNAASTHTASDTTVELEAGQGSQFPAGTFAVFVPDTDEWLWVTSRSGDTLTVERDLNGNAGGGKEIPNDAEIRLVLFENPMQTVQEEVEYLTKAVLGENQLDVTIQATTADGSTSPLTLQDSAASVLFDVDSNGVVTANGAVTVNDTVTVADGTGTDAVYAEDGVDRSSASAETFNVQNSGTGAMTLQQDGTAVVIETRALTGGNGIQAIGDLSADRTVAVDFADDEALTFGASDDLTVQFNATSGEVEVIGVDDATTTVRFQAGDDTATAGTPGLDVALDVDNLGFFGAVPVAQQGPLTAEDATLLDDDTYTAAEEGGVIDTNRTRIAEIETALQNLGLIA